MFEFVAGIHPVAITILMLCAGWFIAVLFSKAGSRPKTLTPSSDKPTFVFEKPTLPAVTILPTPRKGPNKFVRPSSSPASPSRRDVGARRASSENDAGIVDPLNPLNPLNPISPLYTHSPVSDTYEPPSRSDDHSSSFGSGGSDSGGDCGGCDCG